VTEVASIRGVDRTELAARSDALADLVAALLGKTARKFSRQLGGIVIAAADPAERFASVSADDIAGITDYWRDQTLTILVPSAGETFTSAAQQQAALLAADAAIKAPLILDESQAAVRYMAGARNRLTRIGDELWMHARDGLTEGMARGESVPQLAQRVRDAAAVTVPRATVIARTEVVGASNAGSIASMRAAEVSDMTKTWLATGDSRTRASHLDADGQTVGINETFIVGGETADRPLDPLLSAAEAVNCRCTLTYNIPEGSSGIVPPDEEEGF